MESDNKPFVLSKLKKLPEADMEILDDDGHGTGWIWTFAGPGHPVTVEADRRQGQRYLDREAEKERAQVNGRKWKGGGDTIDERRASGIAYIIARLLRWTPLIEEEGSAPVECTPENARRICGDPSYPNVYDQANAFLLAEKSFSKRSVSN